VVCVGHTGSRHTCTQRVDQPQQRGQGPVNQQGRQAPPLLSVQQYREVSCCSQLALFGHQQPTSQVTPFFPCCSVTWMATTTTSLSSLSATQDTHATSWLLWQLPMVSSWPLHVGQHAVACRVDGEEMKYLLVGAMSTWASPPICSCRHLLHSDNGRKREALEQDQGQAGDNCALIHCHTSRLNVPPDQFGHTQRYRSARPPLLLSVQYPLRGSVSSLSRGCQSVQQLMGLSLAAIAGQLLHDVQPSGDNYQMQQHISCTRPYKF
jgi:hypothetical protein